MNMPAPRPNGSPVPMDRITGRPRGSRNLLSKRIIEDITEAWERDGPDTLRILAKEDPATFAKLGIAILPRDVLVSVEQATPGGLDPQDWALLLRVLDMIKACIPADANPGEVFGIIEEALRSHYAKFTGEANGATVPSRIG